MIAAGVALYMLCADGEFGAEVYCGATTEKQAWEVFRPARLMMIRTPDLAEAAGVSTATVSRVLNNRPGVKADTREAVQAAAAAHGYAAEKPGPRRPGPVAIMLPELSNPSFTAFAEILDTL